jgi:exodeoxyribonuclease VII small subunit
LRQQPAGFALARLGESREKELGAGSAAFFCTAVAARASRVKRTDGEAGDPMSGAEEAQDVTAMSFEDALAELEQIVRRLEEGKGSLDDAIVAYERGAVLKRHCENKLQEAQTRVEKVIIGPGGTVAAEPAQLD